MTSEQEERSMLQRAYEDLAQQSSELMLCSKILERQLRLRGGFTFEARQEAQKALDDVISTAAKVLNVLPEPVRTVPSIEKLGLTSTHLAWIPGGWSLGDDMTRATLVCCNKKPSDVPGDFMTPHSELANCSGVHTR